MSAETDYTQAASDAIGAAAEREQDFGGWLSGVLEDVARERGGSQALVAGRPGCWEAEHVRRLAASADDQRTAYERVLPHRRRLRNLLAAGCVELDPL